MTAADWSDEFDAVPVSRADEVSYPEELNGGACVGKPPEWWFPGAAGMDRDTRVLVKGRALCAACEVRSVCLVYAVRRGEKFGQWGGSSPKQRRSLRRALVAGRLADLAAGVQAHLAWLDRAYRTEDAEHGEPAELRHGNVAAYQGGCRCPLCSRAHLLDPARRAGRRVVSELTWPA